MKTGLFIIGDEILSGRRRDQHLVKAIELLRQRGMRLSWAHYLGDERPELIEAFRKSFATDDLVFSFGGIGATPDDHTRQSAAAALGVELALHPFAEQEIHLRMGESLTAQHLKMGEFPQGADAIPNPFNRIPGFKIQHHHFFPGFPQMAWPMMEWVLDTHYSHLHHQTPYKEASIAVFDAQESRLVDLMDSLQNQFDVTVFSLPNLGSDTVKKHIELGAKGEPQAVDAAMQMMCEEVTRRGYEWDDINNT